MEETSALCRGATHLEILASGKNIIMFCSAFSSRAVIPGGMGATPGPDHMASMTGIEPCEQDGCYGKQEGLLSRFNCYENNMALVSRARACMKCVLLCFETVCACVRV